MQGFLKKDSTLNTAQSTAPCIVGYPSWWTSTESHVEQSSISNNLSLKMASPTLQNGQNAKQLAFQFQDQDSSSTLSSSQSEVASAEESINYGQKTIAFQSVNMSPVFEEKSDGHMKSAFSLGAQDCGSYPLQVDFGQPYACIPLSYPNPRYRGLAAPYGPQAMMQIHHTQMMGMASTRVPLPRDLAQDEPIYVNAKQYNAILRRRQYRAKLEAQNKLSKPRKKIWSLLMPQWGCYFPPLKAIVLIQIKLGQPYLHESRHLHALKRERGSGGRFVNKKKHQESSRPNTANVTDNSDPAQFQTTKKTSELEITKSCFNENNRDNIFNQQGHRFSVYQSHVGSGPMQGVGGGNHHYLSVFR